MMMAGDMFVGGRRLDVWGIAKGRTVQGGRVVLMIEHRHPYTVELVL